ncbi:MAG: methionyl-tRNA formyltransferase [Nitrosomonas sp.]|uniref:methionyl-tRNA formyltransferase n=1 Tax=Nitrosomonas sp. TaxID=42353 RepID=UPI00273217C9|nr:methionyl-tRNA formyltransferase [Nitrosomonas sp.]MDP1548867.1 methionyl-tRNA formyltransferase [Nitrosomonas sp.]MDP1935401.1 methionyl-tRNA formyltransferase [Nitrosomonas sp.]MDP2223284.1 methionyl-tRNA formyltransferase [Nitrosomonas sp.]
MRIIFAGTPVFAATALDALLNAGHEIILVLTQPDRPAGRGMKTAASAVKLLAQQHDLALLQPLTLKSAEIEMQLLALAADAMIVAAYGLILPESVLKIPRLGCLNIHASLLPRWRGAAPIQRAILAGDQETGITIMQMDAGLDTGAVLLKRSIAITPDDTTQSLHDKLGLLGAQSIVEALVLLQQGKLSPTVQDETLACYAAKIKKTEAEIDWRQSAEQINRVVRAFNPNPGAYTYFRDVVLKIWQTRVVVGRGVGKPGEIVVVDREGITVACGSGMLQIEIVQKPGGKKLSSADFLAGNNLQPGENFSAVKYSTSKHD